MKKVNAKDVFIRTLECLRHESYIAKSKAAIDGTMSTADKVITSLRINADHTLEEISLHETKAQNIIDWLSTNNSNDDYIQNCKRALHNLETTDVKLETVCPLLCSCISSFERDYQKSNMFSAITEVNSFYADAGTKVDIDATEVIGIDTYQDYSTVHTKTKTNHLVSFYIKGDKKSGNSYSVGDILAISGTVSRNKFTTPFCTIISRPKVFKL